MRLQLPRFDPSVGHVAATQLLLNGVRLSPGDAIQDTPIQRVRALYFQRKVTPAPATAPPKPIKKGK